MQLMTKLLSFLIEVLLLSTASGQIGNAMLQHCAIIACMVEVSDFGNVYILCLEAEVVIILPLLSQVLVLPV